MRSVVNSFLKVCMNCHESIMVDYENAKGRSADSKICFINEAYMRESYASRQ